ncbi:MAG TPA: hypothetical protein VIF62_22315 [Labilithrix sp.]|jgi:hypothetical protein
MIALPKVDLATLPKLTAADVRLLWVDDWYDGPLEAMVEHQGERCLMVLYDRPVARSDADEYRWLLVRLTPEQQAEEERWHTLFAQHVGEHWCLHADQPHGFPADTTRDPQLFYGPHAARGELDLTANTALGWLDELPAA